jgi:hypothetical protein
VPGRLRAWKVTVTARDLQKNAGHVISLSLVEIGIISGCFESLFEF